MVCFPTTESLYPFTDCRRLFRALSEFQSENPVRLECACLRTPARALGNLSNIFFVSFKCFLGVACLFKLSSREHQQWKYIIRFAGQKSASHYCSGRERTIFETHHTTLGTFSHSHINVRHKVRIVYRLSVEKRQ